MIILLVPARGRRARRAQAAVARGLAWRRQRRSLTGARARPGGARRRARPIAQPGRAPSQYYGT